MVILRHHFFTKLISNIKYYNFLLFVAVILVYTVPNICTSNKILQKNTEQTSSKTPVFEKHEDDLKDTESTIVRKCAFSIVIYKKPNLTCKFNNTHTSPVIKQVTPPPQTKNFNLV